MTSDRQDDPPTPGIDKRLADTARKLAAGFCAKLRVPTRGGSRGG